MTVASPRTADDAVLITGIGIVSTLGVSPRELVVRVVAGDSALAPLPGFAGARGASLADIPLDRIAAEARPRIGRLDRVCRLFLSAASLAVDDARLDIRPDVAGRTGLSFGTGLGCLLTNAEYNEKLLHGGAAAASPRLFAYTVSSAAAGEVSIALGITGANVTLHQGFAAGLGAIGYGCDLIRTGKADVVLAGGADALGDALLAGLADMALLKRSADATPFGVLTPGICPSEGAAVLVLERARNARDRGARVWARIDGHAAGFEPTLTHSDRQPTALVDTLRQALVRGGRSPAEVDVIVSSAHGSAVDDTEARAFATVFRGASPPAILAPKTAWGECFAAHGALSVALAAAVLHDAVAIDGAPLWEIDPMSIETAGAGSMPGDRQAQRIRRRVTPWTHRPLSVALVHALCYSGPTGALIVARDA